MKWLKESWRKMNDEVHERIDYDLCATFQKMRQEDREKNRKLREYKRITKRLPKLIAELERTTERLRGLL